METTLYASELQNVHLDVFEGPFDLLLSLLERNKLDIADIQISLIADQYMEILSADFSMDVASEFLVMASTLLHLKSKRLLPKEEKVEEEISEEELIRRLTEYRRFKNIAPTIGSLYEQWSGSMVKKSEVLRFPRTYQPVDISMSEFRSVYTEIVIRNKDKINDNTSKMERILRTEKVSIKDKMLQIVRRIAGKAKATFNEIFSNKAGKTERVTGFLAMLELDRRKRIKVHQKELFGEIIIEAGEAVGAGDDYDSIDEIDEYDKYEKYTETEQ